MYACNGHVPVNKTAYRQAAHDQPWSSASRFRFISFDTLCCEASCFASSIGTFETGLLEISRNANAMSTNTQSQRVGVQTLPQIVHDLVVVVRKERDRGTLLSGTTRTTDTMHVRLNRVRHLVVDNEADVLDVDTTSGEIGGHENIGVSGAQGL